MQGGIINIGGCLIKSEVEDWDMATWVTHLMIADSVVKKFPFLCRHEFWVGNIAPDCNVENEDWTAFTPSREVTHWMQNDRKVASDCERFLREYVEKIECLDECKESFLLGYYAHLIVDAEFQRFIRDIDRVKAVWDRIKQHPDLKDKIAGMDENWHSAKMLINGRERMKDIYSLEKEYLDLNPESGYLTDILKLKYFPDYIDYLPEGAIVRKVKVMGYIPQKEDSLYPYIAMSKEEFYEFVECATKLVTEAIDKYWKNKNRM